MPVVKLNESKHQVSHPTKPGLMKPGEEADAPDLWVRQHTPLVRAGIIEVVVEKPKKKATKKKTTKKDD